MAEVRALRGWLRRHHTSLLLGSRRDRARWMVLDADGLSVLPHGPRHQHQQGGGAGSESEESGSGPSHRLGTNASGYALVIPAHNLVSANVGEDGVVLCVYGRKDGRLKEYRFEASHGPPFVPEWADAVQALVRARDQQPVPPPPQPPTPPTPAAGNGGDERPPEALVTAVSTFESLGIPRAVVLEVLYQHWTRGESPHGFLPNLNALLDEMLAQHLAPPHDHHAAPPAQGSEAKAEAESVQRLRDYRHFMAGLLADGTVGHQERDAIQQMQQSLQITAGDHRQVLHDLGWDWPRFTNAMVKEGPPASPAQAVDKVAVYTAFLRGLLANKIISDEEREAMVAFRCQEGVTQEEHASALDALGMTTAQFSERFRSGNLQQDKPECVVCLEQNVDAVFVPCGHLAACYDCAQALFTTGVADSRVCPVCRAAIRLVNRIFAA